MIGAQYVFEFDADIDGAHRSGAVAPDAGKPGVPDAEATARAVAETFRVVDWNLFAG